MIHGRKGGFKFFNNSAMVLNFSVYLNADIVDCFEEAFFGFKNVI